jgi:hypothetical protein
MIIDTPYAVPDRADCDRLLETLPSLPLAARAAVVERLMRNASPDIRDRALRIGAVVLSDSRLTELLRADDDAVMRNAGSEILLLRGSRSLTAVLPLLHDRDPDVVLQAVLILDRLHDPRALEPLHGILVHPDPNVVQETILAIGRLGDGRSVPHLLPFLDADLWPRWRRSRRSATCGARRGSSRSRGGWPIRWSARWPPNRWPGSAARRCSRSWRTPGTPPPATSSTRTAPVSWRTSSKGCRRRRRARRPASGTS